MNLTRVKYQDSCIYIGLDCSNERGYSLIPLDEVKNVYAIYKIKAHGNYVKDTILIRRRDVVIKDGEVVVKFELTQLHRPDECEIEIISLKFTYFSGKPKIIAIEKSYPLLEIRAPPPKIPSNTTTARIRLEPKKLPIKKLSIVEEIIVIPKEKHSVEEIKNEKIQEENKEEISRKEITVIDNNTSISSVVSTIDRNIESKLEAQTNKLESDIAKLCYETIDLLLSSLPHPEFAEEYRSSEPLVQSIHKYINADLLQNELEEGERV